MMGGTGSRSEFEAQPDFMPDKYESGTPNTIGFAGLGAGATYLTGQTIEGIRAKEEQLTRRFLERLEAFKDQVTVYGPNDAARQTAVISFNVKNISPSDAAMFLKKILASCAVPASIARLRRIARSGHFHEGRFDSASVFSTQAGRWTGLPKPLWR